MTTNRGGGAGEIETFAMANCLMLLSNQHGAGSYDPTATSGPDRSFSCKTCGRKFTSFQALGGHRASHNKYKLAGDSSDSKSSAPAKPKSHACSICGVEFPIGQALGGHMRRHRGSVGGAGSTVTTSEGSVEKGKKRKSSDDVVSLPVLKNAKRMLLDLNLNLSLNFAPWKKEDDDHEIEGGEVVEQEQSDFLKLELRQPINC